MDVEMHIFSISKLPLSDNVSRPPPPFVVRTSYPWCFEYTLLFFQAVCLKSVPTWDGLPARSPPLPDTSSYRGEEEGERRRCWPSTGTRRIARRWRYKCCLVFHVALGVVELFWERGWEGTLYLRTAYVLRSSIVFVLVYFHYGCLIRVGMPAGLLALLIVVWLLHLRKYCYSCCWCCCYV